MHGSAVSVLYSVLTASAFTGLACSWWMVARDGMVETTCLAPSACYQVLYLPYLEHMGCVRVRCELVVFFTMIIVKVDFPASSTTTPQLARKSEVEGAERAMHDLVKVLVV